MTDHPSLLAIPAEMQLAMCDDLLAFHENTSATPVWLPRFAPVDLANPPASTWENTLENLPALGNLARTCKHFRHFTMAMLYKRVRVSIHRPAAFALLIQHFSRFGERATLVKELIIDNGWDRSALSTSQVDFLLQEGQRLGLASRPIYVSTTEEFQLICGQIEGLLIDVLLCQVLNIRKLVLSFPLISESWAHERPALAQWESIRTDGFTSPRILEGAYFGVVSYAAGLRDSFTLGSLQYIATHAVPVSMMNKGRLHKESLAALLRHAPAVTHLRDGDCLDDGYCGMRLQDAIVQTDFPQLKDVQLSIFNEMDILSLANFCPRLERCRLEPDRKVYSEDAYEIHEYPPDPSAAYAFIADRTLKALLPLRFALRDLDIDWDGCVASKVEDLCRLSNFDTLRSLRCVPGTWPPGDSARLIDKLPLGIESLCLGGKGIPVYDIALLLRERVSDGRLPKLKCFRFTLVDEKLESEMAESILRLFEGTNVDCAERLNQGSLDRLGEEEDGGELGEGWPEWDGGELREQEEGGRGRARP